MRSDIEVRRAVDFYQLGLPRMPVAGRSGELLGRGTGTSVEFQEFREYTPGDDIRHLDWSAYARSDSLMVRLYREEISPRTEILLDASRSMTVGFPDAPETDLKAKVAKQLAAMLALMSGRLGGRPALVPLDDSQPLHKLNLKALDSLDGLPFSAVSTLPELLSRNAISFGKQAVRIVISDFLFPHDPAALIRRLAADASALWELQVLTAWEADPVPLGGRRLIDAETAAEAEIIIDRKAVTAYKERLGRLQAELARECRRVHAPFVTLIAEKGLATLCHDELCAAEILRPS